MSEILLTAPPVEPVTTDFVRQHTVIEEQEDDTLLEAYIASAREYVEKFLGRQLVRQVWQYKFDRFPTCDYFELPKAPVQSVSSITYTDTNASPNVQTLSTSVYALDNGVLPAVVYLQYNQTWPSNRGHRNDIIVEYVTGYPLPTTSSPISQDQYAANVPMSIKNAIAMLACDMYENRGASKEVADFHNSAIDRLLTPHRLFTI